MNHNFTVLDSPGIEPRWMHKQGIKIPSDSKMKARKMVAAVRKIIVGYGQRCFPIKFTKDQTNPLKS